MMLVEDILTPMIWVLVTLVVYSAATQLYRKFKWAITTPILITVSVMILILLGTEIEFETYNSGGKYISFFLGPAVVVLGVLFYENYHELKKNLKPFLIAVVSGGVVSIISVLIILLLLDAPLYLLNSLAPKSVTTPIAIAISESVSGIPELTAGVVIAVGIFGNAFAPGILKILGVRSERAIGTALGTASHGIGTAKSVEISAVSGVYSGLALCVNGITTALVTPAILNWVGILYEILSINL